MSTDLDLENVEFASNPDPRCPCVLLLDTSGSMAGEPIAALNEGLKRFRDEISGDELAARRAEVAVVTFDSDVKVVRDFVTAGSFDPPSLSATGQTHMGAGIHKALDLIEARKAEYKRNGVDYYRPWVFMITDGAPQGEPADVVERAAQRVSASEAGKHVAFFAVAVQGADVEKLRRLSARPPLELSGLKFVELFVWLSSSIQARAKVDVGDQVTLPPTDGWSSVQA
ncbi:MAG: VWA domain-containing protein [Planctomycetes bacterium]|nr:VWA domain-containing protein [Planctomycetota bacterium]